MPPANPTIPLHISISIPAVQPYYTCTYTYICTGWPTLSYLYLYLYPYPPANPTIPVPISISTPVGQPYYTCTCIYYIEKLHTVYLKLYKPKL